MKHEEDELQRACEKYLKICELKYIHIPKQIQRHIWSKTSHVPAHVAKLTSDALKGIPDLLIFNGEYRCLLVELKSPKGALTVEQKSWIPFGLIVCRNIHDFVKVVDEFIKETK